MHALSTGSSRLRIRPIGDTPCSVSSLYATALASHKAGKLAEAERLYCRVLVKQPRHADALHFLGVLAQQAGRPQQAIDYIGRAITLSGANSAYHCNLGSAYRTLARNSEAATCFERALQLKPNNSAAHNNLGITRLEQGRAQEAELCFEQARRFNENDPEAFYNLGRALQIQGKARQAIAQFRRAIELKADYAEAHNDLGMALRTEGQLEDASSSFEEAVRLRPDFVEALTNLGSHRVAAGRLDEGESVLRQALELQPQSVGALSNLGVALKDQGRLEEGIECFRKAQQIKPDFTHAANNLGATLMQLGRVPEAIAKFNDALRIQADYGDAHWNRSLAWLTMGNFEQGWLEYEWRWLREGTLPRRIPRPLWDGSPLGGRTILLHGEQGLGDTLQFVRFVNMVAERGGRIILACQKPLLPLLRRIPCIENVVAYDPELPNFDVHAPLMSLPGIFHTVESTIPNRIPYLSADPALVRLWQPTVEAFGGLRVGINWQGNPNYKGDCLRSIPLENFRPLAQVPGVSLISLQKGFGSEQIGQQASVFPIAVLPGEIDQGSGAFMDTAAVMTQLDLLITSDTALAHLAGALGVPTWLALSTSPDWRWLLNRTDSPWYPTLRLFRQTQPGTWDDVFEEMSNELRRIVDGRPTTGSAR